MEWEALKERSRSLGRRRLTGWRGKEMEGWWRGRWGEGSLHSSSQPHLLQPCHLEGSRYKKGILNWWEDWWVDDQMHQWRHYCQCPTSSSKSFSAPDFRHQIFTIRFLAPDFQHHIFSTKFSAQNSKQMRHALSPICLSVASPVFRHHKQRWYYMVVFSPYFDS